MDDHPAGVKPEPTEQEMVESEAEQELVDNTFELMAEINEDDE